MTACGCPRSLSAPLKRSRRHVPSAGGRASATKSNGAASEKDGAVPRAPTKTLVEPRPAGLDRAALASFARAIVAAAAGA